MFFHTKAWQGLYLMIYSEKKQLPMKIEQSIVSSLPALEHQIESFEIYSDAVDFCKRNKNIALVFIDEDCNTNVDSVIKNFSTPYKELGWPCSIVLFNDHVESIKGLTLLRNNPQIIHYTHVDNFFVKEKIATTFAEIWDKYSEHLYREYLPEPLEDLYRELLISKDKYESILFKEALINLLHLKINISWIELLALKLDGLATSMATFFPEVESKNPILKSICTNYIEKNPLSTVFKLKKELDKIVSYCENGLIENYFNEIASANSPGGPGMLRLIFKNKNEIINLYTEYYLPTEIKKVA